MKGFWKLFYVTNRSKHNLTIKKVKIRMCYGRIYVDFAEYLLAKSMR